MSAKAKPVFISVTSLVITAVILFFFGLASVNSQLKEKVAISSRQQLTAATNGYVTYYNNESPIAFIYPEEWSFQNTQTSSESESQTSQSVQFLDSNKSVAMQLLLGDEQELDLESFTEICDQLEQICSDIPVGGQPALQIMLPEKAGERRILLFTSGSTSFVLNFAENLDKDISTKIINSIELNTK